MRDRSYRRHQNFRVIRKRMSLLRNSNSSLSNRLEDFGFLRKYNLTCGCKMCKMSAELAKKEIRKREEIKHPIEQEEIY